MSRGEKTEVAISAAVAGIRKNTCRLTKGSVSSPMRAATGGLAARQRMMPPSISAPSAASVSRSTVRHHSLKGVGCARDAMTSPKQSPEGDPAQWWHQGGLHGIKEGTYLGDPAFRIAGSGHRVHGFPRSSDMKTLF